VAEDRNQPEQPRFEPEIIPPDRGRQSEWRRASGRPGLFTRGAGTNYVYAARIGPFGFALLLLAIAALVALIMIVFIGAFLIWIPVAAVIVILVVVSRLFRQR
jgi:hypothetical protein